MEVGEITVSFENLARMCRFCLVLRDDGQVLTNEELKASRIPFLYKTLLDSELVILSDFPIMFCESCIKELEAAVEIREHFKKIKQFWKDYLSQLNRSTKINNKVKIERGNESNAYMDTEDNKEFSIGFEPVNDVFSTVEKVEQNTENLIVTSEALAILEKYERADAKNEKHKGQKENPKLKAQVKVYKKFCLIYRYKICYKCGKKFRSKRHLVKHLYEHINKKCDICNIQLPTYSLWFNHINRHYPNDYKTRKTHNEMITCMEQLDRRFNIIKMCNYCDLKFIHLKKLFSHQRFHHRKSTLIECYICEQQFQNISLLKKHIGRAHQLDGEPAPDDVFCHICGVIIKCGNFKRHMETTHADGKIGRMLRQPDSVLESVKCSYCSESYKLKNRLHRHVETIHPNEFPEYKKRNDIYKIRKNDHYYRWTTPRYAYYRSKPRCGVCGSKFVNRVDLHIHLETHKNYECEICKRKFIGKQNLEKHLKQHSKLERPFICEICNATFTREPHLKDHVRRMHTTDRPFSCEKCDRTFVAKYEMLSHSRIVHLEMKPYKCSYCDSAFSTHQSKKYHESNHTGKKGHKCKICHKTFLTMSMVETHIGRYHENQA